MYAYSQVCLNVEVNTHSVCLSLIIMVSRQFFLCAINFYRINEFHNLCKTFIAVSYIDPLYILSVFCIVLFPCCDYFTSDNARWRL